MAPFPKLVQRAALCTLAGITLGYSGMAALVYVATDPRLQPRAPVAMPLDKYRCPQGDEFQLCRITAKEKP